MSFEIRKQVYALNDNRKTIFKNALAFFFGTVLSRLSGFIREALMAFVFGATAPISAFLVAYRFANLGRRLFGEGALSPGIIPHFESLRKENKGRALQFLADLFGTLSIFLAILIGIIELILFFALQSTSITAGNYEIIKLTMVMLPALLFLCLYGVNGAILQCEQRYFLPSAAPVFYNFIWIGTLLYLFKFPALSAVYLLSLSILLAVFMQWIVTLPPILRLFEGKIPKISPFSLEVRSLFKPLGYGMLGVGALQINSALDAISAQYSAEGGPAYLWYAMRLQQLPLAIFGLALTSSILPPLSRSAARGDIGALTAQIEFGLRLTFLAIIPSTVAILTFAGPIVNLAYGRGAFTDLATAETMRCLIGYGIGLLPSVMIILLAQGFYASKNYRIPMQAALISVGVNLFLNALFIFELKMDTYGVALSTSIAAILNCLILYFQMRKVLGVFISGSVLLDGAKCAFFAASSAVLVRMVMPETEGFAREVLPQVKALFIPFTLYALLFVSATLIFSRAIRHFIFNFRSSSATF